MQTELTINRTGFDYKKLTALLRRFGLAGFLFFFAKGMLWLLIPLLAKVLWWP